MELRVLNSFLTVYIFDSQHLISFWESPPFGIFIGLLTP